MAFVDLINRKNDERVALVEKFRALLLTRLPQVTMTETGPMQYRVEGPGFAPSTIFIENLFRQLNGLDQTESERTIQRYLQAVVSGAQEETTTRNQIVPMIKDALYVGASRVQLVKEHFACDLFLVYAVDLPNRIATVKQETLQQLGIQPDELRALAIANLRAILPRVRRHGEGSWFAVTAGGDYTASLLLLDDVWEDMAQHVSGDLVVAVPTRDVLLVTGAASRPGITAIKARATELEQGGSYTISQTLLRRKDGRWTAFS